MSDPFQHLDFPELPKSTVMWRPFYLEPVAGSGERIAVGVGFQNGKGIEFERTLNGRQLKALFGEYARNIAGFIDMIEEELKDSDSLESFRPPFSGAHAGRLHRVFAHSVEQIRHTSLEMTSAFVALPDFSEDEDEGERDVLESVRNAVLARAPSLGDFFNTRLRLGRGREYRFSFTGRRAAINMSKLYYGSNLSTYADKAKARILDLAHLRKHDQSHAIEAATSTGRQHYDLLVFHDDFDSPRLTKRNAQTLRDTLHQLEDEADKAEVRLKPVLKVNEAVDWIVRREAA